MKYCTDCSGEVAIPIEDCRKRRVEMNKPDVLSEEQIAEWCGEHFKGKGGICYVSNSCEICGRTIQRDADVAYYEPLIQQAKEEVAREIVQLAIKSDLLCPEEGAKENNCITCNAFWQALKSKHLKG